MVIQGHRDNICPQRARLSRKCHGIVKADSAAVSRELLYELLGKLLGKVLWEVLWEVLSEVLYEVQ